MAGGSIELEETDVPRKINPPEQMLAATVSETAEGIPDDAIGPGQASVPEQADLAEDPRAQALAAKLQGEVDRRRRTGRKRTSREPTGRS
jgi:hypothetical protein